MIPIYIRVEYDNINDKYTVSEVDDFPTSTYVDVLTENIKVHKEVFKDTIIINIDTDIDNTLSCIKSYNSKIVEDVRSIIIENIRDYKLFKLKI
jgi:hypothetical protein